jgi:hypothetical protein
VAKVTFNWYVYDSTDDNEWLISLLTGMYMIQSLLLLYVHNHDGLYHIKCASGTLKAKIFESKIIRDLWGQ